MLGHLRLSSVFLLAVALATGSCSNSKTVVVVKVEGTAIGIYELHVTVRAGTTSTEIFVTDPAQAEIRLPTDFTIEMDRSRTGDLALTIAGRDQARVTIASGSASLAAIKVGEQNDVTVTLSGTAPPPPDGGVDAGPEAGTDADEDTGMGVDAESDAEADGGVDGDNDGGEDAAIDTAVDGEDDAGVGIDAEGLLDAADEV